MKKIITLAIVFSAFIGNAQRTMFGSQNNYVAPTGPSLPVLATTAVTAITGTTATSGGTVSSDGGEPVTSRGLVWGTSSGTSTYSATTGAGIGAFSTSLTSLSSATTYYVRAFATNSIGTAYGNELSFTTASAPTLAATTTVTAITSSTATSGGSVTSTGGAALTAVGVCWSTSINPTTANSFTTNGTSTSFSSDMTGLTASTTYYVRAYATNSVGTSYGSQVSFTTAAAVAPALTNQASFSWSLNQLSGNMPNFYLQATNLTLSQLPTSWTVQWTYKMDEGPGSADGMHWFFRNSSTTGKYSTQMHVYQQNGGLEFWYNSNVYAYSSVHDVYLMTNMTQGTTYKLALTYDGTNLKLYSNGVLKSTFAINITVKPTDSVLQMGSNLGRTIDEFRIWNSTLSQSQISANQDVTAYGSSGLMLYYNFNNQGTIGGNNTAVTSVTDQSGNNRHGTFYNVPLNSTTNNFVTSIVTGY
jgi:hypothetical protein